MISRSFIALIVLGVIGLKVGTPGVDAAAPEAAQAG